MIQRSHHKTYRTAALIGAAVVFSAASHLHAQALTNLFGDPNAALRSDNQATATLTAGAFGVFVGNPTGSNANLGANYSGSVTVPVGAVSSLTETVNGTGQNTFGTPNALTLTATGLSAAATFSATTNLGNASVLLQPNTQYSFTVSRANGSTVSLLGSVNFTLALGTAAPFVNSTAGTGLAGGVGVNAGNLLNNNGSANFTFTTPAVLPANTALNFSVMGALGASAGVGNTAQYVLAGAAINPVPEPNALAASALGMLGLAIWRTRRSTRQD